MSYQDGSTMVDAIALSSPSGHMSKRARQAAMRRLAHELFADMEKPQIIEATPAEKCARLQQRATELRALAARGMRPRAFLKEAKRLELLAAETV